MKRFAPFLFILMLPVSAFAEAVSVVSGEHDGYTRLVFAISPDREWSLVIGQGSAKLVFPAQNLEFEDDGVFTRIPKTRLVSTHSDRGEGGAVYRMTLGCDCEVGAFPYLDAYIVVDISDPPKTSIIAPPTRHFAPVLSAATLPDGNDRPPEFVSWIPPRAPYYDSSPHRVNFPAQTDGVGLTPTQTPDAPPNTSHTDVVQVAPDEVTEEVREVDQELQEAVDSARNSLLHQLTVAVDQGLLDLNGPISEILQAAETVPIVEPEDPFEVFEELEDENQVLIQTAITRDALAAHGRGNQQKEHCPSPEDLDIASWGSGEDFFDELSSVRQGLLREFDEPDFFEVERLVRTYLRYGFGAEARSYLFDGGKNVAQQSLLLDLAAIVDGQTVQPDGPLSQAIGCGGVAGLWALVGTYPVVDTHIDDEPSIIEAFADLPPDIRRLVGPRLASAFLDRGVVAAARQVSDILERAPGDHGTEHELVVGNLIQIEGSAPEAGQAYRVLAEDNSLVATDALIELATLGLTQDQSPPQHLLMDLGASAKIWRGTQKGGQLRRLEALWMAKQGRESAAIDLLVAEIQHDPVNADILQETAEQILSVLSVSEKLKNNFAEIVHTYIEFIPEDEEADKLRIEIAAKLLLAGLPDYAIEILDPTLQRNELDATLVAANANIQAFRPDAALLMLNGAAGDAARKLRVEAYLGMGDFEHALGQLNQFADMSAAIAMPYWFKGDWAAMIKINRFAAEVRGRFFPDSIGSAHRPGKLSLGETLSLAALQEFLADSQSRSAELENLLLQQ
jgi:tetratricopeptide (TPR) repeat protein